ncbi:MAG: TRAP transporter substrate-binding protein DctP [Polyangiaceae bacterium]|nr:TRAP transporter substrate-binding protein DctP [Polyangiaceae bacterium]
MIRKLIVALLAATFLVMGTTSVAHAKTTLKMATLAPPRSPWGKVFRSWAKKVDKKTNGEVELTWLWNGTAGPEKGVVEKIKSGQLAGAAITAVGLMEIHKPIIALQIPGSFSTWAELDAAREKLMPDFREAMKTAGFHLGGFGDVGEARVMSKGFAIRVPADLKGKSPAVIRTDIIAPKLYEVVGDVRPVPGEVTGFLPKLNSGEINVMNTPALAAEQLQWASRLDHMNAGVTGYGIGALVMAQSELDKLPADQKEVLIETGKKAGKSLTKRIRKEDAKAFERLSRKMTVHQPTDAEKAEWRGIFKQTCERLKGAIPGDVIAKIGAC